MGGFKTGAADDDWGEDDDDEDATDTVTEPTIDTTDEPSTPTETATPSRELPWVLTRNSITDGRDKTVQLHLQQSTIDAERDGRRDVESVIGDSVKKADLREAALVVGLDHTDDVADLLREWGYDLD